MKQPCHVLALEEQAKLLVERAAQNDQLLGVVLCGVLELESYEEQRASRGWPWDSRVVGFGLLCSSDARKGCAS